MDVIFQVVIRGRVQGIGFRAWTEITALELGVEGWVRNLSRTSTHITSYFIEVFLVLELRSEE